MVLVRIQTPRAKAPRREQISRPDLQTGSAARDVAFAPPPRVNLQGIVTTSKNAVSGNLARRGYEVLPLDPIPTESHTFDPNFVPTEIRRPRRSRMRSSQRIYLLKLNRILRRAARVARQNRYFIPASFGGAALLTLIVIIAGQPALSVRTEGEEALEALSPELLETANSELAVQPFQPTADGQDAGVLFGETAERLAALSRPPELAVMAEAAVALSKKSAPEVPPAIPTEQLASLGRTVQPSTTDLIHRMGKVKFIAGMIAAHRTSASDSKTDCGGLAKDIVELSEQHGIDPFFVAAIVSVESRFGVDARSKAGALGLMQLLPGTAKEVLENQTGRKGYPLLTHSRTNITLGIGYIKTLMTKYRGNRFFALAAYNWGPANVDSANTKGGGIPGSVRKYAEMVLQRATNWKRHFESAEKSASSLAQSPVVPAPLG